MDYIERYAQTSRCRAGGLHDGEEVASVDGDQVAHICPKCYDRVMPVLNPRVLPGWPRQTLFFVDYEEAGPT